MRLTISIAAVATSKPLLPAFVPARSIACSIFSVVMTPNMIGTPVFRDACLGNAFGCFVADQVVVARRAADNRAEADNGVVFTRFGHFLGDEGYFKGAGDPGRRDVVVAYAVTMEGVVCAAEELAADKFVETQFVETRYDDTKLRTRTN